MSYAPNGRAFLAMQVISCGGGSDFGLLMRPDELEGVPDPRPKPVPKFQNRTAVDISAASFSSAVLTETNEVFVTGLNDEGQLIPEDAETEVRQVCVARRMWAISVSGVDPV